MSSGVSGATPQTGSGVADITYLPTGSGFLYLAAIVDAFSRRVVDWSMATHLRTDLETEIIARSDWATQPTPASRVRPHRGLL